MIAGIIPENEPPFGVARFVAAIMFGVGFHGGFLPHSSQKQAKGHSTPDKSISGGGGIN